MAAADAFPADVPDFYGIVPFGRCDYGREPSLHKVDEGCLLVSFNKNMPQGQLHMLHIR
jgi:hypothetical protein